MIKVIVTKSQTDSVIEPLNSNPISSSVYTLEWLLQFGILSYSIESMKEGPFCGNNLFTHGLFLWSFSLVFITGLNILFLFLSHNKEHLNNLSFTLLEFFHFDRCHSLCYPCMFFYCLPPGNLNLCPYNRWTTQ